jgi:hypothetical protein
MNSNSAWWLPSKNQDTRLKFENEYIRREFGLTLFSGIEEKEKQLNTAKNGKYALVFVDTSVNSLKILDDFPERSVIVFIVSDETYKLVFNLRILLNPRIAMTVRDYPIGKIWNILKTPRLYIRKIRRLKNIPNLVSLSGITIVSGLYLWFSQFAMSIFSKIFRKRIYSIPLGYDSGFAILYGECFDLDSNESLLDFAMNTNPGNFRKEIDLLFFGQKGKLDRQLLIKEAESIASDSQHQILIEKNDNYNVGRSIDNQKKYFELLVKTRYSLCPPGNYSGETFRYYESLLTFAYPLQDEFIFSDPLSKSFMNCLWTNTKILIDASFASDSLDIVLEVSEKLQNWKDQVSFVCHIMEIN